MLTLGEFYVQIEAFTADFSAAPAEMSYIARPWHYAEIRERVGEPEGIRHEGDRVTLWYRVSENGEGEIRVEVEATAVRDNFLTNIRVRTRR